MIARQNENKFAGLRVRRLVWDPQRKVLHMVVGGFSPSQALVAFDRLRAVHCPDIRFACLVWGPQWAEWHGRDVEMEFGVGDRFDLPTGKTIDLVNPSNVKLRFETVEGEIKWVAGSPPATAVAEEAKVFRLADYRPANSTSRLRETLPTTTYDEFIARRRSNVG